MVKRLKSPQFCDECGERCFRRIYVDGEKKYCRSCIEVVMGRDVEEKDGKDSRN